MNSHVDTFGTLEETSLNLFRLTVDDEDAVHVEVFRKPEGTLIRVRVSRGDVPKLIVREGRIARALRTILSGIAQNYQYPLSLDIVEARQEDATKP